MPFEQIVLQFKDYANQALKEETERLKEFNADTVLNGKLARLKFFNTHLEILKQKLAEKTEYLLAEHIALKHQSKLKKQLHSVSVDCIHEYLSLSFNKEE